jgi:hypothetical protein
MREYPFRSERIHIIWRIFFFFLLSFRLLTGLASPCSAMSASSQQDISGWEFANKIHAYPKNLYARTVSCLDDARSGGHVPLNFLKFAHCSSAARVSFCFE